MPLRDHIRTLFNRPTRLARTSTLITAAQGNLPSKLGTWKCACGHLNAVYHLPLHAHPLGILSCRACGLTWHPRSNKIVPSPASYLQVNILLPKYGPGYEEHGGEEYILPTPRAPGTAEDGGYGYVCLNEQCGLSWCTEVKKEWWGRSRLVLAVAGKRWKGTCLCGRKVCVGGEFVVFEVVLK